MAKLVWDKSGEHFYETGVDQCVLYNQTSEGAYPKGVAWNGITAVTESPSGAEPNDFYADNAKYITLRSAEDFGGTIEAYQYPKEFNECNGIAEPAPGVFVGQQERKSFGLCYRTKVGNDTDGQDHGYKLHLIYNATASPSEKAYQTVNDSPELITFSWEFTTIPVEVEGFKKTSMLTIDSTVAGAEKMAALEAKLYGSDSDEAMLPSIAEVLELMKTA